MSCERSRSLPSYFRKRINRIYPAYVAIVLLCALGLFFISNAPYSEYFSLEWVKYLFANIVFLNFFQHDLPGVFSNNNFHAVNGALWTLKIEVAFYIAVPFLIWLMRRTSHMAVLLVLYAASIFYFLMLNWYATEYSSKLAAELGRQIPGQMSYFLAGAAIYYWFNSYRKYQHVIALLALLFVVASVLFKSVWMYPLYPAALGALTIYLATSIYLGNFSRFGDFSYGIYIVHYPTIQILIQFSILKKHPYILLLSAMTISVILSIFLWHLVEKRFLSRNNHYRQQHLSDNTQD